MYEQNSAAVSIIFLLMSTLSFTGIAQASEKTEGEKLDAFFAEIHQENLALSPQFTAWVGLKDNNDKLDDDSEPFANKMHNRQIENLKRLREFNVTKLDEQRKTSFSLFEILAERDIAGYKYRDHHYGISHNFGPHTELPSFMMNMHVIDNKADALAYIERLKLFPQKFNWTIEAIKRGQKIGVIPPTFVYAEVIESSKNVIKGKPFEKSEAVSPLLDDFTKKIDKLRLPKKDQKALLDAIESALVKEVKSAYLTLIAFMKKTEPLAPKEGGATRIPKGGEYYDFQLAYHTTTNYTAQVVHDLGIEEVKRIHEEMRQIMKEVAFKGDLVAFFKHLNTDPRFKYPSNETGTKAYLADSQKIIQEMQVALPKLFGIFPKAKLEVLSVEPYREKSAGIAFYESPSKDGKRPGRYYVNTYDMDAIAKYELEALAYHEAIPGHHMQSAIALELEGIPEFRKYVWFTAYGEGWGLYSEYLPKEIGMYKDPYANFGRLSMELWRACRLVVDTGIHAKGWKYEKAIKYLTDNTPGAKGDIEKSIKRYIMWPGQATAYKIGMIKIQELRARAQRELQKNFDIRRFHDEVLRHGNVPLRLLDEKITKWIAQAKTQSI